MKGSSERGRDKLHTTFTPDVRHIENPNVMHEESDVSVKGVATFVVALLIFGIAVQVGMAGLYKLFDYQATRAEGQRPPMARTDAERLPPPPRLQGAPGFQSLDEPYEDFQLKEPSIEWDVLRKKYENDLNHPAATVDANTHTKRVPIEEAKQALLGQNLPVRPAPPPNDPTVIGGMDVPSFFSAGRQMEKRDQ